MSYDPPRVREKPEEYLNTLESFKTYVLQNSDALIEQLIWDKMSELILSMAKSRLAGGVTAKIGFDLEDPIQRNAYPLMVRGLKERGYTVEDNKDTESSAGYISVTWPLEKEEDEQHGTT